MELFFAIESLVQYINAGISFIAHPIILDAVDECAVFDLSPIIALKPVITATQVIHHVL